MKSVSRILQASLLTGLAIISFAWINSARPLNPAAPNPAAFTPFDVAEISHTVRDFAKWKPLFDADSGYRKSSGLETMVVSTNMENPNDVMIVLKANDVSKAKAFASDPRLKDVMTKAGVVSKPDIQYFRVIRFNPEAKEKQWVIVSHRVKDFDAWIKVFDNEGAAARANQGLFDAALARGIDDPNMVQLVFDIKDVAKAKASIMSEEKKKLMMSAGVQGQPKIAFYNTAQ